MEQQKTETRSITAEQRKRVEEVCFRSLALIGRNCEYLEQHFDRTGADESTRQAVADIDTAAIQLDRDNDDLGLAMHSGTVLLQYTF